MKAEIQILSDLHLEFHDDYGEKLLAELPVAGDVLVVAGDLCTYPLLEESIISLCDKFSEVVYVPGNHEFYHSSFQEVEMILRDMQSKLDNFTWLNDSRVEVAGKNFIGNTLWFEEDPSKSEYRRMLADFRWISHFEPSVYHKHDRTFKYLEDYIEPGDIVVTHHMPSYKCVSEKFKGSAINCFFATHCDKIIQQKKPALWISGHTHDAYDIQFRDTRMIANPYGYPRDCNRPDLGLIAEI